jgi:hypothetical protein
MDFENETFFIGNISVSTEITIRNYDSDFEIIEEFLVADYKEEFLAKAREIDVIIEILKNIPLDYDLNIYLQRKRIQFQWDLFDLCERIGKILDKKDIKVTYKKIQWTPSQIDIFKGQYETFMKKNPNNPLSEKVLTYFIQESMRDIFTIKCLLFNKRKFPPFSEPRERLQKEKKRLSEEQENARFLVDYSMWAKHIQQARKIQLTPKELERRSSKFEHFLGKESSSTFMNIQL